MCCSFRGKSTPSRGLTDRRPEPPTAVPHVSHVMRCCPELPLPCRARQRWTVQTLDRYDYYFVESPHVVRMTGFEPAASVIRTRHSSKLSYTLVSVIEPPADQRAMRPGEELNLTAFPARLRIHRLYGPTVPRTQFEGRWGDRGVPHPLAT